MSHRPRKTNTPGTLSTLGVVSLAFVIASCGKSDMKGKAAVSKPVVAAPAASAPTEKDASNISQLGISDVQASVVCKDGSETRADGTSVCKSAVLVLGDGNVVGKVDALPQSENVTAGKDGNVICAATLAAGGSGASGGASSDAATATKAPTEVAAGSSSSSGTASPNNNDPFVPSKVVATKDGEKICACNPTVRLEIPATLKELFPSIMAEIQKAGLGSGLANVLVNGKPLFGKPIDGAGAGTGASVVVNSGSTGAAAGSGSTGATGTSSGTGSTGSSSVGAGTTPGAELIKVGGIAIDPKAGTVTLKDGTVLGQDGKVTVLKDPVIIKKDGTVVLTDGAGHQREVVIPSTDPKIAIRSPDLMGHAPISIVINNNTNINNYNTVNNYNTTNNPALPLPAPGVSTAPATGAVAVPPTGSAPGTGAVAVPPSAPAVPVAPVPVAAKACLIDGFGSVPSGQTVQRLRYVSTIPLPGLPCQPQLQSATCSNGQYSWSGGTASALFCNSMPSSLTSGPVSTGGSTSTVVNAPNPLEQKASRLRKMCATPPANIPACSKKIYCASGSSTSSGCREAGPDANTYRGSTCSTPGEVCSSGTNLFVCSANLTFNEATDFKCEDDLQVRTWRLKKECVPATGNTVFVGCPKSVDCASPTSTASGCKSVNYRGNTHRGSPCVPNIACAGDTGTLFSCIPNVTFDETTNSKCP